MRIIKIAIGLLALASGILFMAQGSGYFPYPQESFMISETRWIYWGALIAALGMVLVLWGFARRRRY